MFESRYNSVARVVYARAEGNPPTSQRSRLVLVHNGPYRERPRQFDNRIFKSARDYTSTSAGRSNLSFPLIVFL